MAVDGSPQINKRLKGQGPDGNKDESDSESSGSNHWPTIRRKVKSKSAYSWCVCKILTPRSGKWEVRPTNRKVQSPEILGT